MILRRQNDSSDVRRHRAVRIAAIAAAAVAVAIQIGLSLRPDARFLERPHIEDAYYAFAVSRSFAQGNGFSVDGSEPTNGVQPLVCLLYSPVFALIPDEPVTPLRFILLINIACGLLGAWVFAKTVSLLWSSNGHIDAGTTSVVAGSFFVVNYSLLTHLLNGLETGMTLFLVLLTLYVWQHYRREAIQNVPSTGKVLLVGALIGVSILSRIDAIFLLPAVAIDFIVLDRKENGTVRVGRTLRFALLITVAALAVSLPWWYYNVTLFGHPLPVSGLSQVDLAPSLWAVASASINVVLDSLLPGLHTPEGWDFERLSLYGLLVPFALWAVFVFSSEKSSIRSGFRGWKSGINFHVLRPLLIYSALLLLAYTFFFAAPHFQERYLVVFRILGVAGYATLFLALIAEIERSSTLRKSLWLVQAIGLVVLLVNIALLSRFYNGSYNNPLLQTVAWIEENTEPDEQVGVFQSGTAEYFLPHQVTNLDGKVNVAAHAAFRAGTLGEYVDSIGFAYIIDWALYTDRIFSESPALTPYQPVDTLPNNMVVWKLKDSL